MIPALMMLRQNACLGFLVSTMSTRLAKIEGGSAEYEATFPARQHGHG